MPLFNTYKEYITEKFMLEYLKDGVIPTADQIEDDLEEYMKEHLDLSVPLSKYIDFSVDRGEESSAALIQEIAEITSQDIGVVTREMYKVTELSSRFYDRWSFEAKRLSSRAKQLEQRIDSLLLLNQDTAGFFSYVGDIFTDMNAVNLADTTAKIDTYGGNVSLNPVRTKDTDMSRGAQVNLTGITDSQVTFTILSNRPGTTYDTLSDANALTSLFKTEKSTWEGKVTTAKSGDLVAELKVNLLDSDFELTKVSFDFTGPIGTTSSTTTLEYSADGYTWYLIPSSEATKPLSNNMVWTFPKTTIRWIKFIIRKASPDEGTEYTLSASSIKVFGDTFNANEGNILISKALEAKDNQDNSIRFSQVALDACSILPDKTSLSYYISTSKDNLEWTDWMAIAPSDEETITYPKVINIGGVDWRDNLIEDNTIKLDDSLSQKQITQTFDTSTFGYRFKSNEYGVVNTGISVGENIDPDSIGGSVVLWRNVRYKDVNYYPDIETVRDVQRGWGYDGGQYSCYFEVLSSDGIILDFGSKLCILDDVQVSGVIKVSQGVHKFITDANNWSDITTGLLEEPDPISTEEILQKIDPLYPHNHKLVIEGYPYPTGSAFKGDRVYTGTDLSAEFYSKKVSLFELENNISDYGHFSIRNVGDLDSTMLAVVTNFDVANSDYTNELFHVKWRSGDQDAELYTYIKFKAELYTEDISLTPTLCSYRLKLGI